MFCKKEYDATDKKGACKRQKFCSTRCRDKQWQKNHPERWKEFQRNWLLSKPILCRWCKKPIPNDKRASGVTLCSDKCRREKYLFVQEKFRTKIHKAYREFKESQGCSVCGYKRYAGSLDFHHVGGKDFRIDASRWWCNSSTFQKELARCILVCKNCHYELHQKGREDKKIAENGDTY